ncbi:MAG: formate dehydrogenase accessory sulfurtransferase FdhD, partial [Clostridium sp.]|nr:formate dehydrogenase accessory sulfurtransferase FdhD [Clostridium sp.]
AIGYALLNRICMEECILFTSGRVPKDMVEKTVRAGIPVLVSKSVATKEAADYALACGLQLIWRAWPDRYETYI